MDHIRLFDWCSPEADIVGFVKEEGLDNCVTERILRNKFRDPLISSDSDGETPVPKIDWDEIFSNKKNDKTNRIYVPGLRNTPPHPKLSALTKQQHYQCLKVLCADNPNVLEAEFMPRPTKQDHRVFEEVKETYAKEQKEYIEWAKNQWLTGQCARALRPKPVVEMVYDAEFKMRTAALESFPKTYWLAAQIPLETSNGTFEIIHQKDLKKVNISELPQIQCPEIVKKFCVLRPCPVPEPCSKHLSRFILPIEDAMSILPLTEVYRELAQYALDNGATYVASESALKCLVEQDREWMVPLTVCEVIGPDGDKTNVVVLGSEFPFVRESAPCRTYKAFKHLLQYSLIPETERLKLMCPQKPTKSFNNLDLEMSSSEDDEGGALFIDIGEENMVTTEFGDEVETMEVSERETPGDAETQEGKCKTDKEEKQIGPYRCTCKDTLFSRPPPRSFKKWQVRGGNTEDNYNIIVHCAHKIRGKTGETLLEPIPEYQLDLGGSELSSHKIRSLALSLHLRRNASLLNVRIDGATGDVVTYDYWCLDDLVKKYGNILTEVSNTVHTALNQLQGLLPGRYVLKHESIHGTNALLYAPGQKSGSQELGLEFESRPGDADEAKQVRTPPTLVPVLLPLHKFRKILPCAFTPYADQVVKETRKLASRQKIPPQAIKLDAEADSGALRKWPKRKRQKKKLVNGQQ